MTPEYEFEYEFCRSADGVIGRRTLIGSSGIAVAGERRTGPFELRPVVRLPSAVRAMSRGFLFHRCSIADRAGPPHADENRRFAGPSSIGETGFEPATARPPAGCATRLRHSPW